MNLYKLNYVHGVKDWFHSFLCLTEVLATCPYFLSWLVGEGIVKNFELSQALKDGYILAEWN